jgi:hypothetical protein
MADLESFLVAAQDPAFWHKIAPHLPIEGPRATAMVAETDELRTELLNGLHTEGYHVAPPILEATMMARMAQAVERLHYANIPTVFSFVFDAFWQVTEWFRPYLEAALGTGFKVIPAFWSWYVESGSAGWPPHRDRLEDTLRPNRMPNALSIWIPLTDAAPDNGCMYVLPANRDRHYHGRTFGSTVVDDLQDVRALPARAGSFLCWTQNLLHWSGRGSARAQEARISVSIEYQRGDVAPMEDLVLEPGPPPFRRRLALIGSQLRKYTHMKAMSDEMLTLAKRLEETCGP